LPPTEYGKPVVHALTSGKILRTTPVLPQGEYASRVVTTARLEPNGEIVGVTTSTASGVSSFVLRGKALKIQSDGQERTAQTMLRSQGKGGNGSFDVGNPHDMTPLYAVTERFAFSAQPGLLGGERFVLLDGLRLLDRPGTNLMGHFTQLNVKDTEPTPCMSGHQVEELTLELPYGKRV
jgi:hypothetical protein